MGVPSVGTTLLAVVLYNSVLFSRKRRAHKRADVAVEDWLMRVRTIHCSVIQALTITDALSARDTTTDLLVKCAVRLVVALQCHW
jgi:hypothetical protein